jgi:hypothetical protein
MVVAQVQSRTPYRQSRYNRSAVDATTVGQRAGIPHLGGGRTTLKRLDADGSCQLPAFTDTSTRPSRGAGGESRRPETVTFSQVTSPRKRGIQDQTLNWQERCALIVEWLCDPRRSRRPAYVSPLARGKPTGVMRGPAFSGQLLDGLTYAASCRFRYSLWTSSGVL